MNIKTLFASLFLLLFKLNSFAQQAETLNTPPGWTTEHFALPPAFAADLPFKGAEEIRFSPEWNLKKTEGYWTYCYQWTLEGKPSLSTADLETYLRKYYAGLIKINLSEAKIDTGMAIPVKLKLSNSEADKPLYTGRLIMLDYMTQTTITLNIRIRVKSANVIFFELSALPYENKIWETMDAIGQNN